MEALKAAHPLKSSDSSDSQSKKRKESDEKHNDDRSSLSFRIIVSTPMLRSRTLLLLTKTCTKIIWNKIPPAPAFKVIIKHDSTIREWVVKSTESSFDMKRHVLFSLGWSDVMNSIIFEEGDILTFTKKEKGKKRGNGQGLPELGLHVHRWDPQTQEYMKVMPCSECAAPAAVPASSAAQPGLVSPPAQ